MPTYVITDDTNSLCLAITGGETKNIDKDNAVVRVIPAGTGLNTTAIDQLSIEHDGDYATRMPWNDVTVSGVSPSSVSDFRTKVMTILNNNSSGGGSTAPITVDLADAGVMLAGVPAFPVEGQVYLINGLGITGVDNIRTVGILDVNTSDYVFNNNCEAYVTALGVYVPCTYDVATNVISGEVILWAGDVTQNGGGLDPTIDNTHINVFATDPTFTNLGAGEYRMEIPVSILSAAKFIPFSAIINIGSGTAVNTIYSADNRATIYSGTLGTGNQDSILNVTYVELKINL